MPRNMTYFVFTIPSRRGQSVGGLGHLIGEIIESDLKLAGFSAFVSGRRTTVFCVPLNPERFRTFARKRKLRTSERTSIQITRPGVSAMNELHRWAIDGEIHPAISFSRSGRGFVYLPRKV